MLNYCLTIIIYIMVYFYLVALFEDELYENGWINHDENDFSLLQSMIITIVIAAIPVIRTIISCVFVIGAFVPKEDFEEKIKERFKGE